ncbi:hypothetical protein PUV54_05840 [Hyphococcus flavus]|uniref:Uncharacterized protein n=1 Tax=Hyphococcus flavus TaxID=1866326 RepID=A0AAE9ZDT6_9PROT|nr:hypothetical protein [Hyphococcus flavus]WDI32716.1 hypothetical protein PUV54_05840 [Hyphococcus flavus]
MVELIKAIGENSVALTKLFDNPLVGLAERRLNHNKIDSLIFDFGFPNRLLVQSTPTNFGGCFEIDILTLSLTDVTLEKEKKLPFKKINIQGAERLTIHEAGYIITTGIRLLAGRGSLEIVGGDILASLSVYGWAFPTQDQQRAFSALKYKTVAWL